MRLAFVIGGLFLAMSSFAPACADPCGLVPPVFWAGGDAAKLAPIERIGVQRTYVFYRNGVETLAIRPGFSGSVDEFGMLIPFPTPPAIRKLPDNVFEQIAAAIDPPEIVIDVRPQNNFSRGFGGGGFGGGGGLGGGGFGGGLAFVPKDQVRVIREEAVGMYEVAVLAAGSAKSLKRWMDDHGYTFPSGMDVVCPEYIQDRWCFVAVKTKVKQKGAAQPRPGQRRIDNDLPAGSTFDGYVQAMGFRFRTRQLVVPMRLSVHNAGELRNVVYLLSDTPSKIQHLPEEFVRRQVSGSKLYDQLTQLLPLRIIGGTLQDVPSARRRGLSVERDPRPHNGVAAELFASDIVAARTRQLENRSEAFEKDLQKINESLNLRGVEIERDVQRLLFTERARLVRAALKAIEEMTLTVIDGDFPREVLARENLTFAEYHMPLHRSNRAHYDANKLGRADIRPGTLHTDPAVGSLPGIDPQSATGAANLAAQSTSSTSASSPVHRSALRGLSCLLGFVAVGAIAVWRFPERKVTVLVSGVVLMIVSVSLVAASSSADEIPAMRVLMKRLGVPSLAEQTVEQIVTLGDEAVPALITQSHSRDVLKRGWAIVCLGRIGGDDAMAQLHRLQSGRTTSHLVKTWSAAAMIKAARTDDEFGELAQLVSSYPALSGPVVVEFRERLANSGDGLSVEGLLAIARRSPALQQTIANEVFSAGPQPLVRVMLQSTSPDLRRQAAGYLASLARMPDQTDAVAEVVVGALKFDPASAHPPWRGGPLFVPGIQWKADGARQLVDNLIRWMLWADRQEQNAARRQAINNLRIPAIANLVGYRIPPSSASIDWLRSWKGVVGEAELKRLLAEQDLVEKYSDLLDG